MLIAKPEHNKTSILKQFECIKGVYFTTDLSPKPLIEALKRIDNGEIINHFIIPDFIKVVAHNKTTADTTVTTLNSLIEEGIKQSNYYGQEVTLRNNIKCGLITSITPELYKQQFKMWNDKGFLTNPSDKACGGNETRLGIHQNIKNNTCMEINEEISKIRRGGQKDISIDSDVGDGIALFVDNIVSKMNDYEVWIQSGTARYKVSMNVEGFRLHKQMRLLSKAIAFDRGLLHVNYECLSELKKLMEYIALPNEPKVI